MRTGIATSVVMMSVLAASGCGIARRHPPPDLPTHAVLAPAEAPSRPPPPARTVLVLSGGGDRGAFAVGVLKGWSESGDRPEFDVVTGVSTGALIAPFAFLGPDYDEHLAAFYTSIGGRDVYRRRPLLSAIAWGDALADTSPLRRRIAAEVTAERLDRIAEEHRKGRRLYVATTDLDSKRSVVWDLGAIAASGEVDRRELFCNVLLASCAVPAIFPPVPIDVEIDGRPRTELHVDGIVGANVILPPSVLGIEPRAPAPAEAAGTDVYVILSGTLSPPRKAVERRFGPVSGEALAGVLAGRQNDDLLKVYLLCRYAGAAYHLAAIPEDTPFDGNPLAFDAARMRHLYDVGRDAGRDGAWSTGRPGSSLDEPAIPRAGPRLRAVDEVGSPSDVDDAESITRFLRRLRPEG